MESSSTSYTFWIVFHLIVIGFLFVDLKVLHRKAHEVSVKESLLVSLSLILTAALFAIWIGVERGLEKALEFTAGYLIEYSLSVDNLFLFTVIFQTYRVPERYRHRVLFWGVIGAIGMRALFIFAGIHLVRVFHPLLYIFGIILLITGIRMFFVSKEKLPKEEHWTLKLLSKYLPFTSEFHGEYFTIRKGGKLTFTPLALALIAVELTDLMFALDSIPAVMGITLDPFIVYSSNILAVLGLRSLYFALNAFLKLITYLHYALAVILAFVGIKLLLVDLYKIPVYLSLGVIFGTLAMAIIASLLKDVERKRNRSMDNG
jgi:tellurite resistance protein TerC